MFLHLLPVLVFVHFEHPQQLMYAFTQPNSHHAKGNIENILFLCTERKL